MGVLQFLLGNRWMFSFILLSLSFIYDIFWRTRDKIIFWRGSAPTKHKEKLEYVQRQVLDWPTKGKGRKMCTSRPQWMAISSHKVDYKSSSYKVEVNLMDVLEINPEKRYVRCEPLVTIARLIEVLVSEGWMIPIVPEIHDLTIGGLVMGGGLESTSHKYGIWQHICTRYEVVTADGSVKICTKQENRDLYYAIPWSYGTLGFLTSVDLDIVPFKPYIKLVYQPTFSLDETVAQFTRETRKDLSKKDVVDVDDNDSVEGIMFSQDKAVVMTGTFIDDYEKDVKDELDKSESDDGQVRVEKKLNRIGRWYKPWFYLHVKSILERKQRTVEYIPTVDFFFRHSKPLFWLMPLVVPFGNNVIFRYLFGWLMPIHHGFMNYLNDNIMPQGATDNMVVQDYGIPLKRLKKALEFYHEELAIYPMWLCPMKVLDCGPVQALKGDDLIYVDVGIYGPCEKKDHKKKEKLRKMEKYAREHEGYIGLYAEIFMTWEEFDEMFDGTHYRKMKAELPLAEEAFPTTYEKVSKSKRPQE